MADRTCSVGECIRPPLKRGMCSMHYQRWRKSGDPGEAQPRNDRPLRQKALTCAVEECTRPRNYRLWCQRHYELNRSAATPCSIDGCERVSSSRGWCRTHYERWRRLGTVELPAREQKTCSQEGCVRSVDGRGWCQKHYVRWKKHGSPEVVLPPSGPKGRVGQLSASWRGSRITYTAAHARVVSLRGQAKNHACQMCDQAAMEWAYDHADPNELIGDEGHGYYAPYSCDPTHYMPLCVTCHRRFDRKYRAGRAE